MPQASSKDALLMELACGLAEALPGGYGPLDLQCFLTASGEVRVIEINARFGGGYPLAHRAGARFTDWLLQEIAGESLPYYGSWTDDLAMLRYDEAVFVPGAEIRSCDRISVPSLTSTTHSISNGITFAADLMLWEGGPPNGSSSEISPTVAGRFLRVAPEAPSSTPPSAIQGTRR